MKEKIKETNYIGGEGSLTLKEELALKKYFASKKKRKSLKEAIH